MPRQVSCSTPCRTTKLTPSSARDGGGYIGPTILLTLIQIMISWAVFAPPVLAKQALPDMGLDPAWIGMQPTILFTAATFSSMMSAGLVARYNPMRASQIMVLLCAAGSICIATGNLGLSPSEVCLSAPRWVRPHQQVHIFFRASRRDICNRWCSRSNRPACPLGGVLAGFVGPPADDYVGLAIVAILVVAGACLATAVITEIWTRGYARFADPAIQASPGAASGRCGCCSKAQSCAGCWRAAFRLVIAQYALTTFIVLYLQEDIGLSVITAGAILAVAQASGGTGRIIFGAIASRWTTPLVTLLMLAMLAASQRLS